MLRTMAERGFPLTKRDVRQLAFQYAERNKIKGFSQTTGRTGYYFRNFMKRNQGLGMRKPEVLSSARAAGLNNQVISQWFQVNENLLSRLGLRGIPSHLWNCDETGLQWGQLFIQSLPKNDPRPHILLLDGHSSHMYNLDFINLMKKTMYTSCATLPTPLMPFNRQTSRCSGA